MIAAAILPTATAIFDMSTWTTIRVGRTLSVCTSVAAGALKYTMFWARIVMYFIIPTCIMIYCNVAIVRCVRAHIHNNTQANARDFRTAQFLTIVAFVSFIICWLPWLISQIYFIFFFTCHIPTVLNVCTAIGHIYCTMTAIIYLIIANKRLKRSTSVHSDAPTNTRGGI